MRSIAQALVSASRLYHGNQGNRSTLVVIQLLPVQLVEEAM